MYMYEDFFELALEWIKMRRFDLFSDRWLEEFCQIISLYIAEGWSYPESLTELRSWVYTRIRKNFKYKNTGYLNEHAVIGVLWGALLVLDKINGDGVWGNDY